MPPIQSSRDALRAQVRPLLDERSPQDALAYYYAFHHAVDKTELVVHVPEQTDKADGFLIRARTGMDLFRPLVTFRAESESTALTLFHEGLPANRPVYLTVPEALAGWVNKHLRMSDAEMHRIYQFNPAKLQEEINVRVLTSYAPDGSIRCEIRARTTTGEDRAGATSGLNWQSPRFAELYVWVEPAVRGRGWGRSVVKVVAREILKSNRRPLYVVAESNDHSIRLAEAVGFEDTGLREYIGQAIRTE